MRRAQVGQKRGRAELEALDVGPDGAPRKKARAGFVAQQWITIYNKHQPMKQRCAVRLRAGFRVLSKQRHALLDKPAGVSGHGEG